MSCRKNTSSWAKHKNRRRLKRKFSYYTTKHKNTTNRERKIAPLNFSMLTNRPAVLDYINSILDDSKNGKYQIMDLGNIQKTDYLSISILISIMMDNRIENISSFAKHVQVRVPSGSSNMAKMFNKCHFNETVTKGQASTNFFFSRTDNYVNTKTIEEIIDYSLSHGVIEASSILNPILVEMFSNTNNHANSSSNTDKYPWYLSIVDEDDRLCFSVIDLGVGIYESLRTHNALKHIPEKEFSIVSDMYENRQSKYLSQNIPKGLYSSTKLHYRGKGLKEIYLRASSSKSCLKFDIITNRAMVDLVNINNISFDSDSSFNGTSYYWEMKKK